MILILVRVCIKFLTLIFYLVTNLVPYLSSGFQLILSSSRQIWVTCGHDKSPPANGRLQPNVLCLCIYLLESTKLWSLKVHCGWNLGKYSRVSIKTEGNLILFWMFFPPTPPYSELLVY